MLRHALVLATLTHSTQTARADDLDPLYACHLPAAGTKLRASFQPETSLRDLATWVTGFTCKNIVFSADVPKHATKVTIMSPKEMTAKQALALFVDAVEATGLVVQIKPDTIIIKLGPKMPRGCPDKTSTTTPVGGDDLAGWPETSEAPSGEDVQTVLKGIRRLDGTHYEITAAALDTITANPMVVAKGARVVPSVKDGKPWGVKLYAVRPSSIWAKLGFTNGDTILSINGVSLDSADKALDVYAKVREAKNLDVAGMRRGRPLTLSIKVTR